MTNSSQTSKPRRTQLHLGVPVRAGKVHGLKINRETYARINKRSSFYLIAELYQENTRKFLDQIHEDPEYRFYTDEWCQEEQQKALENFDLNMRYFHSLDHDEFDKAIKKLIALHKRLRQYDDLNLLENKKGLYVMILDDYCQAYIGVSQGAGGIKERIRQHWRNSKQFDRLLFGGVHNSILSIDSFRALDTSRVLACSAKDPYALEEKLVKAFPRKFLLNRIGGGSGELQAFALAMGLNVAHTRDLSEYAKEATSK